MFTSAQQEEKGPMTRLKSERPTYSYTWEFYKNIKIKAVMYKQRT